VSSNPTDLCMDYVEFPTADIAATRKFYTTVFGWKFTDYGPSYTSFNDGRISGGFDAGRSSGAGGPLVVIYAVDLAEIERKVVAAGGRIVKPVFAFPGGRRFHFADPGGNELAVWST
jgi:uncharacterized protein